MSHKYSLQDDRIPRSWYNIAADLPSMPPPPLHPGTGQPIGPDDLAPLFPMALIGQEVSTERYIEIPDPIRDVLAMWRPTPLFRADNLEAALGTDCKIFYKYEGTSPPDPQRRLIVTPGTETGRPASKSAIRATLRLSSPA